MNLKQFKKAAAILLSTAMVFSIPHSGRSEVSASVNVPKYVKLNTTFKTLKEGQKGYRLYLTNNRIGWKVKKVTVSDKSVVAAYGKTAKAVLLKGKKAGRASVTLHLETVKRKKNDTKKLKCSIKVISAAVTPEIPETPAEAVTSPAIKSMTVSSQEELDTALANTALENLSIETTDVVNLKIQTGSYPNVALSVDAPNAEIENSAVFKSITIRAIRENTWIEDAIGNNLQIDALKARIVVNEGAKVNWVDLRSIGAEIEMEVNGAVSSVAVSATMKIKFAGNATLNIPIIIGANAGGTELTASVPVSVTTDADANIVLNKGAEESTVKINLKSLMVKLTNNTSKSIETINADNVKRTVPNTGTATVITQTTSTAPSSSYYPGSSSSGSSSSGSTVRHTLPTFTIKASVRIDTTTMGALLIDKKDIHIQGGVNPQIKTMQYSGNSGEHKWNFEEDGNGTYIFKNSMLGSDYLEETIERGRGTWVFLTVQDQEAEYSGIAVMGFGEILKAGNVKTFEGVMTKKTDITVSFDTQVISGPAIAEAPDKGWIRLTIPYESVKFGGGVNPKITGASNCDNESGMSFSLIAEDTEKRWMTEKNGRVTYEEMLEQVKNNIERDGKFLYMTFSFADNGKKYIAYVSTSYRDFFGDDPEHFTDGKHSYTTVLYETE